MKETQREREKSNVQGRVSDENAKRLQVLDSSLDYKGRVPLKASTGSWKSTYFVMAMEFSEKLVYFGLVMNLISYMTKIMHHDLSSAATSVSTWVGVTTVTPLLGGFFADAYTGRFSMVVYSTILYVMGLGLMMMTQYIPSLKPCGMSKGSCQHATKLHELLFFFAIYLVSLASGGIKPSLPSFGADQFDDNDSKERKQKMSFFNWWNIILNCGFLLGVTLIVYIEDYVAWGTAILILTINMVLMVFVFLSGRPFYRYRAPQGSPLTPLLRVLVAAVAKRHVPYPSDPGLLYEVINSDKLQGRRLEHTNRLRFLDKAAITEENKGGSTPRKLRPWRLATVTDVEELKLVVSIIPIWLCCLIYGLGIAQTGTFYIKQGSAMDRKIFKNFEIPAASLSTLNALGTMISVLIYDKFFIPSVRKATGNERGMNILTRIGAGMAVMIVSLVSSALVEWERLKAADEGNIMSVYWLTPIFLLTGVAESLALVGMQEFFYDQVPDKMRSLGMSLYLSAIGVGHFFNSFLIVIVDEVTGKNGGKKWIGKDVNHSRLDYFYWLLVVLSTVNICVFWIVAKNYSYKNVQRSAAVSESFEDKMGVPLSA